MKKSVILAASTCFALSACSIREGRIATPSEFRVATEQLELQGMGGGRHGRFRLGGAVGSFTRSAERQQTLGPLLVTNRGGGSFEMAASPLAPQLSGSCRYREREVNVGPLSLTPGRLSYHCMFRRHGRPIAAELVLQDPKSALGTLHGRADRIGHLYLEGSEIAIRSIHHDERGGLAAAAPLGYMFESQGREIGAVDLNGPDKTLFVPRDPNLREAVLAAALALSIFWDPAVLELD